jgi:hypothetical protein
MDMGAELVGGLAAVGLAVGGYLLKREMARIDKAVEQLSDVVKALDTSVKTKPLEAELARSQLELRFDNLKTALESKNATDIATATAAVLSQLEKVKAELASAQRASSNDLESSDEKFEKRLAELERLFNEWRLTAAEKFVSKTDFIRESTVIESRISNTKRSVENLDDLLKTYLRK